MTKCLMSLPTQPVVSSQCASLCHCLRACEVEQQTYSDKQVYKDYVCTCSSSEQLNATSVALAVHKSKSRLCGMKLRRG